MATDSTIITEDSPRWYYLRGRDNEGLSVLKQLYPDDEAAQKVQSEIQHELREEKGERLQLSNLIIDKSPTQAVRRIRDGVVLIGVAYLMGINMIFYYMTTIFYVYIGLPKTTSSACSGASTTTTGNWRLCGFLLVREIGSSQVAPLGTIVGDSHVRSLPVAGSDFTFPYSLPSYVWQMIAHCERGVGAASKPPSKSERPSQSRLH